MTKPEENEEENGMPKEILIDGVRYVQKPKLEILEEPYTANTDLKQLNG